MGPKDIPERWEPYIPIGSPVRGTRFIAFKVPLKESICNKLAPKFRWTVDILLSSYREIGMVVDLTMTTRYYDYNDVVNKGVDYCKIPLPGRKIPPEHLVKRFFAAVDFYLDRRRDDSLIGIHCTHGVNRTGYMIARYLIQRMGYSVSDALECITVARGHPIERDNYVSNLGRNVEQLPKIMDGKDICRGRADGEERKGGASKRPADKAEARRKRRRYWERCKERKKLKKLQMTETIEILDTDPSEVDSPVKEIPDRSGETHPILRVRRIEELTGSGAGHDDVVLIDSDSDDCEIQLPDSSSVDQGPEHQRTSLRTRSFQELVDDIRWKPNGQSSSLNIDHRSGNAPNSQSASMETSHSDESIRINSDVNESGIPFRISSTEELTGVASCSNEGPIVARALNESTVPFRIRSTAELTCGSSGALSDDTCKTSSSVDSQSLPDPVISVGSPAAVCNEPPTPSQSGSAVPPVEIGSIAQSSGAMPFRIRTTMELMDKNTANSCDLPASSNVLENVPAGNSDGKSEDIVTSSSDWHRNEGIRQCSSVLNTNSDDALDPSRSSHRTETNRMPPGPSYFYSEAPNTAFSTRPPDPNPPRPNPFPARFPLWTWGDLGWFPKLVHGPPPFINYRPAKKTAGRTGNEIEIIDQINKVSARLTVLNDMKRALRKLIQPQQKQTKKNKKKDRKLTDEQKLLMNNAFSGNPEVDLEVVNKERAALSKLQQELSTRLRKERTRKHQANAVGQLQEPASGPHNRFTGGLADPQRPSLVASWPPVNGRVSDRVCFIDSSREVIRNASQGYPDGVCSVSSVSTEDAEGNTSKAIPLLKSNSSSSTEKNVWVAPDSSIQSSDDRVHRENPGEMSLDGVHHPSGPDPEPLGDIAPSHDAQPPRPPTPDQPRVPNPLDETSPVSSSSLATSASPKPPTSPVKIVKSDRSIAAPKLPWTALSDTSWDALYR